MVSNSPDLATPMPASACVAPILRRSTETRERSLDRVVSEYLAAWNAVDDVRRRRHLQATWNEFGSFEDPLVSLQGRGPMSAHIAACRAAQPDARWGVTSDIAHHHGRILFAWEARDRHGRELLAGHSFGELDAGGRIGRMVGFFSMLGRTLPR